MDYIDRTLEKYGFKIKGWTYTGQPAQMNLYEMNTTWSQHFISYFLEILKTAQYKYPRLRYADLIHDGLLILITCVDAA